MAVKKFEESLKEESLKLFEEGIKTSRLCTKQLEEAERKVEILLKGEGETLKTAPFTGEDAQ
jgi:exodeoxyribonuclease VII small subunit